MSGAIKFGRCKLTLERGRFVKSHIIPEALTEKTWRDPPLTQQGKDGRTIKKVKTGEQSSVGRAGMMIT